MVARCLLAVCVTHERSNPFSDKSSGFDVVRGEEECAFRCRMIFTKYLHHQHVTVLDEEIKNPQQIVFQKSLDESSNTRHISTSIISIDTIGLSSIEQKREKPPP